MSLYMLSVTATRDSKEVKENELFSVWMLTAAKKQFYADIKFFL